MTDNQGNSAEAQNASDGAHDSAINGTWPTGQRPQDVSGTGQYTDRHMNPHVYTGSSQTDQETSDTRIKQIINIHLLNHEHINVRDIDVSVNDGEVTLTGTAEDEHIKRIVEETVASIPGVAKIYNQIEVKPSDP